jgi:hypothetical protein
VPYNYLGGDPTQSQHDDHNVVRAAIENVTGSISADQIEVHSTYAGTIFSVAVSGAAAGNFSVGRLRFHRQDSQ